MEEYIVKIKSYSDNSCIQYGNGIVISDDLVITPDHIVTGNNNFICISEKEIHTTIESTSNGFALLKTKDKLPSNTVIFSDEEILDDESKWSIHGYISDVQIPHEVTGVGFHINEIQNEVANWNCILESISTGSKNNYKGLSGSPVFCNNRIVGILQRQEVLDFKDTELKMATVSRFKDLLPSNAISKNEYKIKLFEIVNQYTESQIKYNKSSRKYIPDIYVEEWDYKEMVRYFADPFLFAQKTLSELMRYDWKVYNDEFKSYGLTNIDFHKYEYILKSDNFFEDIDELCQYIEECIDKIEKINKSWYVSTYNNINSQKWVLFNNTTAWRMKEHLDLLKMITTKYLLLTKEAGQGKTNFLCDFTENFLLKKEYYVIYFNAGCFSNNPMESIVQMLTINNQYNLSYATKVLQKEFQKNKRPFIVVIDGLNENTKMNNFCDSIKSFLEKCEEYPFIKVLMTTRIEFYEERFGDLVYGTYQNKYLSIQMRKSSKEFNRRIFDGYLNFFDISIIENTLMNSTYKKLTQDLLLLRFFCEANTHKKNVYMYDVYIYEVFELYTMNKCSKYATSSSGININRVSNLFNDIISRMIANNNYFYITTEDFTKDEIQLINKMIDNEVVFKEEILAKSGLINSKVETIGFTFDEYRDYCITNYLLENYDEEQLLNFLNQIEQNKSPICEGVQKYLFYLSHTKYKNELKNIIKKASGYEDLYWRHIWSIEEVYIDEDLVFKCKDQIIYQKSNMIKAIEMLITRYDCSYYKKINIKILMNILDELENLSKDMFDSIISLFPFSDEEDTRYYALSSQTIFSFNSIIKMIKHSIDNDTPIDYYVELVRFTIYILKNDEYNACNLWLYFYDHHKATAYKILKDMNLHNSSYIQSNTATILSFILNRKDDIELQRLLDINDAYHKESIELKDFLAQIFNDRDTYDEDN